MSNSSVSDKPIRTLDTETDPFKFERRPEAFNVGLYSDGGDYIDFWGAGCIEKMRAHIYELEPSIIYIHNGGRFDVLGYLMAWIIGNDIRVISNRIVKAMMPCRNGFHELRDSYAIMPIALKNYKGKTRKLDICIGKLENNVCYDIKSRRRSTSRQVYKSEIREYMKIDCVTLYDMVRAFIDMYGIQLTIGTTAMKELKKFHDFETLPSGKDAEIRALYFYGGRVDCLRSGILRGNFKLYDVNSMYAYVMANFNHPTGSGSTVGKRVTDDTCFITATGRNYRAFPVRRKDGGLDYTVKYGKFHVTRHEWDAALRLRLFVPHTVHMCFNFERRENFAGFVNHFYHNRIECDKAGDEAGKALYKAVLVNAYGKFAQSPANYKEYTLTEGGVLMDQPWRLSKLSSKKVAPENAYMVWTKPSLDASRFNVATGASITGAARSVLMEAIATATNPIYCDTDSLLCEDLQADKDASILGAWKLEATVDEACIAGKKLYAFFRNGQLVKKANKGFKITGADIRAVCMGMPVTSYNDAPTFKLDGSHSFVKRNVRMTV